MSTNIFNKMFGSSDAEPENVTTPSESEDIYFYDADENIGEPATPPPFEPEAGEPAPQQTAEEPADTMPEPAPQPRPATPEPETCAEPAQISMQLDDLFAKVEEFQRIIVSQNRMIERYNDDIVAKMQTPLLLQIIQYVDTIQNMLRNADELEDRGGSPDTLYRELKNDIETFQKLILADLENYNIHQYQDTLDNALAFSRRQEVIDREISCNQNEFMRYGEETTTYYRTELPGYFMLMPDKDGKRNGEPTENILRREQVIKIIYKPSEI